MLSGGTIKEILLSISDEDIRKACEKYLPSEQDYDFTWATMHLIEIRDMIKKAWSVLDALKLSPNSILGRLAASASDQFEVIFREVNDYKQGSEKPQMGKKAEHDRVAQRLRNYIESVTSGGPWDSEKVGGAPQNSALYAQMLALQLEQQSHGVPDVAALKKEIEELKGQAKTVSESLGTSASIEAVRTFGQHYEKEADAQIKSRNVWLCVGFGSVVLLIVGVILFSLNPNGPLFGSEAYSTNWIEPHVISHIVEKLLLLSIFAFLARFGFHQYSIRMHLLSAYRQKAVLANTFELFLAAETMAARRDLIMTEVISSLATFVPDGYIRKDAPELHPLAEIARLVGSFKGKDGK